MVAQASACDCVGPRSWGRHSWRRAGFQSGLFFYSVASRHGGTGFGYVGTGFGYVGTGFSL